MTIKCAFLPKSLCLALLSRHGGFCDSAMGKATMERERRLREAKKLKRGASAPREEAKKMAAQ
jgi:hypothetical protein